MCGVVVLPYSSEEFVEEWKFYKEYIEETFGSVLSQAEQITCLQTLFLECEENETQAIAMLDWNIINLKRIIEIPSSTYLDDLKIYG